jgi:polyhydroxyalkanoate synthase
VSAVDTPERQDLADAAAPLDALLVDAALGPRRFLPDASTVKFATGL